MVWRKRLVFPVLLLGLALSAGPLPAQDGAERALGATLDLLPPVLSAVAGELGLSGQLWFARDHLRFRLVGARVWLPRALIGNDAFADYRTDVVAAITDYTFGDAHDGFWLGGGLELWLNRIDHEATGTERSWTGVVGTLGGGYIWRFHRHFYLEPWGAVHLVVNPQTLAVGSDRFKPKQFSGEVSLKLGWMLDL